MNAYDEVWMVGTECEPCWAKFTAGDGEPMPCWARIFSPCHNLYWPLLYLYIRSRNRRKRTLWPHGSHRISISLPEYICSFLPILTTAEPLGGASGRLLGPWYPLSMCILSGGGLGMLVSDHLSSSLYRCTDREHLVPSSLNINPHFYTHPYTLYIHFSSCRWCTSPVDGTPSPHSVPSPHFLPSHLIQHPPHSCI